MKKFKIVLETVFIEDYRTTALILEGGEFSNNLDKLFK